MNNDLKSFVQENRRICWEAEYEGDEFCIGEEKVKEFFEKLPILDKHELEAENKALKAENHQVNVRLSNYQGDLADMIISLEEENKELKEAKLTCEDCGRTFAYILKVEKSRDALLEKMSKYFDYQLNGSQARRAIKKALKEKEA